MEDNTEIVELTPEEKAIKRQNKSNWLGRILLKYNQGLPLTIDEWGFYMSSFVDGDVEEIEKLAKSNVVQLQKISEEARGEVDAETFWCLKQRDAHLSQNLLKTIKQGRRDDSTTLKNNLSTFNRAVKDARKRGGFYAGEGREFVKTADDVIDLTKGDNATIDLTKKDKK